MLADLQQKSKLRSTKLSAQVEGSKSSMRWELITGTLDVVEDGVTTPGKLSIVSSMICSLTTEI